jgi:uncharacterized damage-inducible protein DinB
MSRLGLYQELYDHEKDCNEKMLAMIESIPAASQSDARFQQAVSIAGHLAACRENWLARMTMKNIRPTDWYDEKYDFAALRPRFTTLDSQWADYLANLDEARLAQEFEFAEGDEHFSLPTEVQIVQLLGHASYHRGQMALLVDQLGGEVADTDYADWWWENRKEQTNA